MASATRVGNTFIEGRVQVVIILEGMRRNHCNSCHCCIIPFVGMFCLCPACLDQWYPRAWYELNSPNSPIPFSRGGGVTEIERRRSSCRLPHHPPQPCTLSLSCSRCGGGFQYVRLLLGGDRDALGRQNCVSSFHRYHKLQKKRRQELPAVVSNLAQSLRGEGGKGMPAAYL